MNRKTLWFSLILLVGAGLSIILMVMREHKNIHSSVPGGINAFMVKPSYKEFNKKGRLHFRMNAKKMRHFTRQDTSLFTGPKILIYTDDRIPWYISSKYGKSQNGTKKVLLYKNVVLFQPQKINHPETTIHTSELTIYPNKSLAETDKKVQIKQPGSIVYGKGIRANFTKGVIKLLKQSRGTYEPASNKP